MHKSQEEIETGRQGTNVALESLGVVLKFDKLHGAKHRPEVREELAYLPILRGQVFKAPWLFEPWFLHPIEGKPVQQGRVELAIAYFGELPFEALIGLLEE